MKCIHVTTGTQNQNETLIPSEGESEAKQCGEITLVNVQPLSTQGITQSRLCAFENKTLTDIAKDTKKMKVSSPCSS